MASRKSPTQLDSGPGLWSRHLAATAIYAALVCASNATLLPVVDRALPGAPHEDPYVATWLLGWELRHLETLDAGGYWHPGLCYPDTRWSLTRLESHLGQALLALPFYRLSERNPVAAYNGLFLANQALAALATYCLCWSLTRSWPAALLGGAVLGLSPYLLFHRNHVSLLAVAPIPLCLLGLVWWARGRARAGPVLAAAAGLAQVYSSQYYAVLLATVAGLFLLGLACQSRPVWRKEGLLWPSMAVVLVALGALPVAAAYVIGHGELELAGRAEQADIHSAQLQNWLAAPDSRLLGDGTRALAGGETALYPGLAATLLAGLGLSASRARRSGRSATAFLAAGLWSGMMAAADVRESTPSLALGTAVVSVLYSAASVRLLRRGAAEAPLRLQPVWAWIGLTSAVLALGPTIRVQGLPVAYGMYGLLGMLPIYSDLRAPGRFGVFFILALAVLASHGMARLLRLAREGWRPGRPLAVLACAVWAIEAAPWPALLQPAPLADPPAVYRWLAAQPAGPYSVLELPTDGTRFELARPVRAGRQLMYSLVHGHPVSSLWAGHNCPPDARIAELAPWDRPGTAQLADFELYDELDVRWLVIRPKEFDEAIRPEVLAQLESLERLMPVAYRDAEAVVLELPFWKKSFDPDRLEHGRLRLEDSDDGPLAGAGWVPLPGGPPMEQCLRRLPPGLLLFVVGYDEAANGLWGPPLEALHELGLGAMLHGRYSVAYAGATATGAARGQAREVFADRACSLPLRADRDRLGPYALPADVCLYGSTNPWHGGLPEARIRRGLYALKTRARGLSFLLADPETLETVDFFSYDTHRFSRPRDRASWLHTGPEAELRLPAAPEGRGVLSLGLRLAEAAPGQQVVLSVERTGRVLARLELSVEAQDLHLRPGPGAARLVLRASRPLVLDWARWLRED